MTKLQEYYPIIGHSAIDELQVLADRLRGVSILTINATAVGGGVAEILTSLVPMLQELGVDIKWDVIKGGSEFYQVTKKIHNALHGKQEKITKHDYEIFEEYNRFNREQMELDGDIIFIHDPQPVALVEEKKKLGNKWIWRCHIDTSTPDWAVWRYLRKSVNQYDAAVFSAPHFLQKIKPNRYMISPSIDPLCLKNCDLDKATIRAVLRKYKITAKKPMITQISRFDRLKDPIGVIQAYRMVKRQFDCQLVLAGGGADDDPEAAEVLREVRQEAAGDPDIHVLSLEAPGDTDVNALQRASTVIVQKSLREGFGLTVSEAMWKGKPIVASATGGIPFQIINGFTGLLTYSIEGTAYAIDKILCNPAYAKRLGYNAREYACHNLLITRHVKEYLMLFISALVDENIIRL